MNDNCSHCRRPMYLKVLSNMLVQSLRQHLNHTLKKRTEQRYLYVRLQLVDRQFHFDLDRQKWQSYFDLGSQHCLWPVRCRCVIFFYERENSFRNEHRAKCTSLQEPMSIVRVKTLPVTIYMKLSGNLMCVTMNYRHTVNLVH
jgi:hypothetical protein